MQAVQRRPATALQPHHWDLMEAFHPGGKVVKVPNDHLLDRWLAAVGAAEDVLYDLVDDRYVVEVRADDDPATIGVFQLSVHGRNLVEQRIRPCRLLLSTVAARGRRGLSLPDAQQLVDIRTVDELLQARMLYAKFADHIDPDNTPLEDARLGVWLLTTSCGTTYLPRKDR